MEQLLVSMKSIFKKRWFLPGILLIGLILRLIYLWQFSDSPLFSNPAGPDVQEYDDWAREIIAGKILWETVHIHAPAYPLLLAALYKLSSFSLHAVRLLQLLAGLLCFIPLFYALKKVCAESERLTPYLFLVIAALYPPLIYYQAELISEALLVPLLSLSVALLYFGELEPETPAKAGLSRKYLWFAGAGLTAGLAAATHPMSLIFIAAEAVLLPVIRWETSSGMRKKLLPTGCFIIAAALIIAPVCLRNSVLSGRFVLIQNNSGLNLFIGNNPDATGTCYVRPGPQWNALHNDTENQAAALKVSEDRVYSSRTLDFIREKPLEWLNLLLKKAVYVWNFRELISGADAAPLRCFTALQRGSAWAGGAILTLGLAGLALAVSRRRTLCRYRHFILLSIAFWAGQILTVTSGRYRLAMLPALFVFAAFLIAVIVEERRKLRNALMLLAYCVLAALIVYLPSPPVNAAKEQAEADSLLGEAYFKENNYPAAEKCLMAALLALDDRARCLNMLGVIAEKRGNFKTAEQRFADAVQADPESPEGYMNLAITASDAGDFAKAEKLFAQALAKGPGKPDVLYNYGFYLERRGNIPQAEQYYRRCLKEAPSDRRALNSLGIIEMSRRSYGRAAELFAAALSIAPGNAGLMLNLAAALASGGRQAQALDLVEEILIKEPENHKAFTMKQMLAK
ncbi:MAG: tetratricopeptide repeat protein [Victivallaceae bacterium]